VQGLWTWPLEGAYFYRGGTVIATERITHFLDEMTEGGVVSGWKRNKLNEVVGL